MTPPAKPRFAPNPGKEPDRLNAQRGPLHHANPAQPLSRAQQATLARFLQQNLSPPRPIPTSEKLEIQKQIDLITLYPKWHKHLEALLRKS